MIKGLVMRPPVRQRKALPGQTPHPGSKWIDANKTSLPDNEWVAANRFGLVASDDTIDGLMAKIKDKNVDLADVAIAFITSDAL
jgi:hypothetical protein